MFFGSALKGVGVSELLGAIADWAPAPRPQPAKPEAIEPGDRDVTGFVFKVQANMDPNHRDRIAFVRICSGEFRRGMKLRNVRAQRDLTIANPMFFFAQDRELADDAVAGDVIGIPNHGTLSVGDTLSEGRELRVTGIPNFAPEIIRRVHLMEAIKAKALVKALHDLAEEGVTQVFRPMTGSDWLVGVVGQLQIEVLSSRLASEYGVAAEFENAGYETARWIGGADRNEVARFVEANRAALCTDRNGTPVYLVRNVWELQRVQKAWPAITFATTWERV